MDQTDRTRLERDRKISDIVANVIGIGFTAVATAVIATLILGAISGLS